MSFEQQTPLAAISEQAGISIEALKSMNVGEMFHGDWPYKHLPSDPDGCYRVPHRAWLEAQVLGQRFDACPHELLAFREALAERRRFWVVKESTIRLASENRKLKEEVDRARAVGWQCIGIAIAACLLAGYAVWSNS